MSMKGATVIAALKQAQVRTVVALPDIVTCAGLLWPIYEDSVFQLIPVSKEDEGVSICAGLSYCDHRAVLLMQHTGFLDSINAIRAIAVEYQLPIIMLVGLQGMEADGRIPKDSSQLGIRMLTRVCDAMNLHWDYLENDGTAQKLSEHIDLAYRYSQPRVYLIPQPPTVIET